MTAWAAAAAQDDPSGPSVVFSVPTYELERVDVAEAGVSLLLPPDWSIEVPMDQYGYLVPDEYLGEGLPTVWGLLRAESEMGDSCELLFHPDNPMPLAEQAAFDERSHASDGVVVESLLAHVGRGIGYQIDKRSSSGTEIIRMLLFEVDGDRFELRCGSAFGENLAWLDIADSVVVIGELPVAPPRDYDVVPPSEPSEAQPVEPVETAPPEVPDDDTADPSEMSPFERRLEFPEFGVALTIPRLWTYELGREVSDYPLPDEFGEDATVPATQFLSAFPISDGVCWVETYAEMPMDPEQHAEEHGWALYSSSSTFSEMTPEATRVQLPAGEGYRTVYGSVWGLSATYAFDVAGSRFLVDCMVGFDGGYAARSLAASVKAIGDEPPEPWLQRLEFADAGIAITLPVDWEVLLTMGFIDTINVAGPDTSESDLWVVTHAYPDEETSCDVYMLSNIPLSLEDHGQTFANIAAAHDPPREAEVVTMTLPIGDAVRVTETSEEGTVTTNYLFDVGGNREYLRCSTPEQPDDAWLSVAETIEPLAGVPGVDEPADETVPPGVPADASYWSELGPLESTIAVDDTAVMRARCEQVLWIQYPDGSFSERVECLLNDDPVGTDEVQGSAPDQAVALGGGACEWISDFWLESDGSEVWAESWEVGIEPDGSVVATSEYGAELLECEE